MFWTAFIIVTCIKTLFIPSYRSTDFEVHRNWLAITHSLDLRTWYTENTSEWTLDYPPYFAYFEYALSQVAKFFDHEMLKVNNLNHASEATILFQRLSVIVTDFVFALGANSCAKNLSKRPHQQKLMLILLLSNVGLFIVDHIHFQYNGFLSGILLLSISALANQNFIVAGLLFSALLMLKHIYLYIAPAFIIYMFRNYCFKSTGNGSVILSSFSLLNLSLLGISVIVNVAAAMGPFILSDNLFNVITRLFPFKRGLCHAYWAPNIWAVYNVADKALVVLARYTGLGEINSLDTKASMTGGLVQDIHHSVLPNISPLATMVLTVVMMLPALVKLWLSPNNIQQFIKCLCLCGWTSFLFGWHVHEKAILLVILPMTILGCINRNDARNFLLLSTVGHLSLLPLLFTKVELVSKLLLYSCYTMLVHITTMPHSTSYSLLEKFYLLLSVPLVILCEFVKFTTMPFLPLLLYSLYCAVGVIYTYVRVYAGYLRL